MARARDKSNFTKGHFDELTVKSLVVEDDANLPDTTAIVAAEAGTAEANKIPVLGADKNLDVLAVADLKLGADEGTSVTASADEINKLDGAGEVVASGTAQAHIADPAGAATDQDDEARAAIASILDALEEFGIVLPAE